MARSRDALGALAICAALLTTSSVGAAEEKRPERRVEVIRDGGSFLGVSLEDVTQSEAARLKLPDERGAIVKTVEQGSPAAKAGLEVDDVIQRFQGEAVRSSRQLARLVREEPAGRTASIEVSRGGATHKLQATLGEREAARNAWRFQLPDLGRMGFDRDLEIDLDMPEPPEPPETPLAPAAPRAPMLPRFLFRDSGPRKLGIEYQEIADQLAKFFKLPGDTGVLVVRVDEQGPAAKAGIRAGDVILKLDDAAVRNGDELRRALEKTDAGTELKLTLQRDGKPLDLVAKLGGPADARRRRGSTT